MELNQNEQHDSTRRDFGKLVALAVGGVFLGTSVACQSGGAKADLSGMAPHACAGMNDCKGQGGCKTADHACAGQNECKGQGGCATVESHSCAGLNECKGQGGCSSSGNGCAGKNDCKGQGGCAVPVSKEHVENSCSGKESCKAMGGCEGQDA